MKKRKSRKRSPRKRSLRRSPRRSVRKSKRKSRRKSQSSKAGSKRTIVYLKKSTNPAKKFMVYIVKGDGKGKTVHFGARGMSDYTKHKDRSRMKRYSDRHRKKESWSKAGIGTAGFWSKNLLWNRPSISASKRDISSRFGITFRSGWPKK